MVIVFFLFFSSLFSAFLLLLLELKKKVIRGNIVLFIRQRVLSLLFSRRLNQAVYFLFD